MAVSDLRFSGTLVALVIKNMKLFLLCFTCCTAAAVLLCLMSQYRLILPVLMYNMWLFYLPGDYSYSC